MKRALDAGGPAADQRGHRSAFDPSCHGEKASAFSDHGSPLGSAAIGLGIVGFGNGRIGRRFSLLDPVYGGVLAVTLWMTIDLDYPGIGMIRVINRPIIEALATMK